MYVLHLYAQLLKDLDPNRKKLFQPWDNSQPHLDFAGCIKLNSCEAAQHLPQDCRSHLGSRCAEGALSRDNWLAERQKIGRAPRAVSGALGRILTYIDMVTVMSRGARVHWPACASSLDLQCRSSSISDTDSATIWVTLQKSVMFNEADVRWYSSCQHQNFCGLGNQGLAFLGEALTSWWLVPASRASCSESAVFCFFFVIQQNCWETESLGFIYSLGNQGRKVDVCWDAHLRSRLRGQHCASSPATLPACVSLSPALSLWSFLLPNGGAELSGLPSPRAVPVFLHLCLSPGFPGLQKATWEQKVCPSQSLTFDP